MSVGGWGAVQETYFDQILYKLFRPLDIVQSDDCEEKIGNKEKKYYFFSIPLDCAKSNGQKSLYRILSKYLSMDPFIYIYI